MTTHVWPPSVLVISRDSCRMISSGIAEFRPVKVPEVGCKANRLLPAILNCSGYQTSLACVPGACMEGTIVSQVCPPSVVCFKVMDVLPEPDAVLDGVTT